MSSTSFHVLALLLVWVSMVGAASTTSLLKTKWSLPFSLSSSSIVLAAEGDPNAMDGTVVLSDDNDNVHGVDAATGTLLWTSVPPPPMGKWPLSQSYALDSLVRDVKNSSNVFAIYGLVNSFDQGIVVRALQARSGRILYNFTIPSVANMQQAGSSIVVASSGQVQGIHKYDLSPTPDNAEDAPALVWSKNLTAGYQTPYSITLGEDVVVLVTTNTDGITWSGVSLDLRTGEELCTFPLGQTSLTMGGNLVVGIRGDFQWKHEVLYNAFTNAFTLKCAAVTDLHQPEVTYAGSGDHFYLLNNSDLTLTQLSGGNGTVEWHTNVTGSKGNRYTHQLAIFPEVHDPRYYIGIVDGTLNVIAKKSGAVFPGQDNIYFPFGPGNSQRQLLFQISPFGLANPTFLLPNLQGWTIFEARGDPIEFQIVEVNHHTPISPPLTYMNTTTMTPYLSFAELARGELRAAELA